MADVIDDKLSWMSYLFAAEGSGDSGTKEVTIIVPGSRIYVARNGKGKDRQLDGKPSGSRPKSNREGAPHGK